MYSRKGLIALRQPLKTIASSEFLTHVEAFVTLKIRLSGFLEVPLIIVVLLFLLPESIFAAQHEKNQMIEFAVSYDRPTSVDAILNTAFKRIGYDFTITATNTENAQLLANSGENDGASAHISGLSENYKNLVMVPFEIERVKFCAYAKTGSPLKISSWDDLSGLRVGHLYQRQYTEAHLPEDALKVVKKVTVSELIAGLEEGEYDVAVTTHFFHIDDYKHLNIVNVGIIDEQPMYPYVHIEHKGLIPELAAVLDEMEQDGTIQKIKNRESLLDIKAPKNILHISSYSDDMKWASTLNEGLISALSGDEESMVHFVGLNSNRLRSDNARAKSVLTSIRTDFIEGIPDVIVVSGNAALRFAAEYYYILFKDIPIIFCDITTDETDIAYVMEGSATGVLREISAADTVTQMLGMFPGTENIFVINDYMEAGQQWRKDIENQLSAFDLDIEYSQNVDINELLETVEKLPENTVILSGFYCADRSGRYFAPGEFQKLIHDNSSVPVFGLTTTSIGYGQLGGRYTNPYTHGVLAGEMALKILNGEEIESIPIYTHTEALNEWIFDVNIMKKWDIKAGALPDVTVILNKKPTFYELNPGLFIIIIAVLVSAFIIMAALVGFMYILRKRNKELLRIQKNLHTAEELLLKDVLIKEIKVRLEKTIESAPLCYVMTVDGIVVEANEYSKVNLDIKLGGNISKNYQAMADKGTLMSRLKDLANTNGETVKFKMTDGSTHRFYVRAATVEYEKKEALVYWAIDIEQTEQQRDALKRSEEDLKRVIDALPMPMTIANPRQRKIIYANHSFTDMFEFNSQKDVAGLDFAALYPERQPDGRLSADVSDGNIKNMLSSNSFAWEFQYISRKQKIIDAAVFATSIMYAGEQGVIFVYQDIAEEKNRIQMLLNAAEKEREANKLKSRFLVNMSHEIRTPMNAVIGLSKLAVMKEQTAENLDTYKKINISAQNLLAIVNDILDFSKIEAEKLELFEEDFCLEEVISNAFMISAEKIGAKRVEMLLNMDADAPYYLYGDKTRLWQILKNILDNSAKYTEKGRIILTVSVIKKDADETELRFEIKDTGLGMTEEQLERLFIPFEQFHEQYRDRTTGTGLGMAITRQLLELMGGRISVNSKVNIGTTTDIVITFKNSGVTSTVTETIANKELEGCRILVVDDEYYSREIIKELLLSVDALPVCVQTGQEALEKVREYNKKDTPFNIIILDYLLEGENGIQLAEKMRELIEGKSKLLMVSAYSKQLLESDIKEAGFDDIIEKPFVPSSFIQKLCRTILSSESKPDKTYPVFSNARILLCEDNLVNQEVAIGMLEVFGITPVVANDGEEALKLLEEETFDLIFMDILMPVMDGHEATIRIRSSGKPYKDIPIVAMTANVMLDEINKCIESGMNGHLGKPLDIDKLSEHLSRYFDVSAPAGDNGGHGLPDVNDIYIEGIDIEGGVNRFGGKKNTYLQALKSFAKEPSGNLAALIQSIDNSDLKDCEYTIHNLKGVAGNLGITKVYELAEEFEKTLRAGAPNRMLLNAVIDARKQVSRDILKKLGDGDED